MYLTVQEYIISQYISSISGNVFLCQVYDKKIIIRPISYQIPHEALLLISDLKSTSSLADMSGPKADKGYESVTQRYIKDR